MEGLETVGSALLTLGLVAVAVALSLYERLDLEKDIGIAVARSFVQLAAVGYAIDYIFGLESLVAVVLLLAGMVGFAAWTSSRRARGVPRALPVAAGAIGVAAVATLGVLLLLGIVPATARYLIPLGGRVIGNAMIPLIDSTKTTGIIFLPGAMVGMIIAGADPLEAARLQIVVLYMLLGSVSIAAILVGLLSYRSFFTARHQLKVDLSTG